MRTWRGVEGFKGWAAAVSVGAVCSLLMGCASFQYDGVNYRSRATAVDAARRDVQISLENVPIREDGLPGRAAVVLPSRSRIREKGVIRIGSSATEQVEYVVDVLELSFEVMGLAVERSRLFESVEIITADDPASQRPSHDWILWLHLQDPNTAQWYLRRQGTTEGEAVPVDTGVDRHRRAAAWIETVREKAVAMSPNNRSPAQTRSDSRGGAAMDSSPRIIGGGTAFSVGSGGYFLTNHHVVSQCREISASPDGAQVRMVVVASDAENDLAVLKAPIDVIPVAFAPRTPRQGSRVVAVGFPLRGLLGSSATTTEGVVSNLAGPRNDSRFLQVSTPVQPGSSGGPIFDESGRVVGIVVSKLDALRVAVETGDIPQNVNFAIKSAVVTSFLDVHEIDYVVSAGHTLSTADISEMGRESTLAIDCWQ